VNAQRTGSDDGFTLVELLVSISILGMIMVVLTTAVFMGLRATKDANGSMDESNAASLTAVYFTRDVQGAETISVNDSAATCGGAAALKLTSLTTDRIVAYAVTGSPLQLVRRLCSPRTAAPTVTILAPQLTAVSDVVAANSSGKVTLTVNQPSTSSDSGYPFTVSAVSRISP
jgi:prepilin-type N-terminal cleavage/methylation domain-containing protein